ncbi:hypothetical protein JTY60_00690 [symbiont of Argiope bruennichi]|uniref:hypothetical protein n=1 Tax=symbiont of Argiope bruennichi TaxID=2810479 RepID=UPI003DA29CC4
MNRTAIVYVNKISNQTSLNPYFLPIIEKKSIDIFIENLMRNDFKKIWLLDKDEVLQNYNFPDTFIRVKSVKDIQLVDDYVFLFEANNLGITEELVKNAETEIENTTKNCLLFLSQVQQNDGYARIIRDSKRKIISFSTENVNQPYSNQPFEIFTHTLFLNKEVAAEVIDKSILQTAKNLVEYNIDFKEFYIPGQLALHILHPGQVPKIFQSFQSFKILEFLRKGVIFFNPLLVVIDRDVVIEEGAIIYPFVTLLGKTVIKKNAKIESNCVLKNVEVGEEEVVKFNTVKINE